MEKTMGQQMIHSVIQHYYEYLAQILKAQTVRRDRSLWIPHR